MTTLGRRGGEFHAMADTKRGSPSPLSHGIAVFDPYRPETAIPYEEYISFFIYIVFAQGCRPFFDECAPSNSEMSILDER